MHFSEQFALGCFFEVQLESFAGCVIIRQYSSSNVTKRQKTSLDVTIRQSD